MRTIFANTISAIASVAFTTLAVAASAPAVAAAPSAPHAIVRTADLDLQSDAGHQTAMRRIQVATARVCDTGEGDRLAVAACRSKASDTAVQALDRLSTPVEVASR